MTALLFLSATILVLGTMPTVETEVKRNPQTDIEFIQQYVAAERGLRFEAIQKLVMKLPYLVLRNTGISVFATFIMLQVLGRKKKISASSEDLK